MLVLRGVDGEAELRGIQGHDNINEGYAGNHLVLLLDFNLYKVYALFEGNITTRKLLQRWKGCSRGCKHTSIIA